MVQEEEAMRIIIEFEKNRAWNKVPILRLILSIFKGVKIGFVEMVALITRKYRSNYKI